VKALVTGGGGFLGEGIVRALLARGDAVRVLARGDYPALKSLGAETSRGDIRDATSTTRACAGMDVVFHVAAKAGGWGDPKEYEAINIDGTENVIAGCRAAGVPALVYTSTPSIVADGHDITGGDESLPIAKHFLADYPRTKAVAEQAVTASSDDRLATISIRPHFIWGPGDRHLLPRLVERSRAGRLRQVGHRDVKVDTVYIDNCVHAHLLAADRLREGKPLGGNVYFVSDGEPIGVWTMANRLLAAAGAPPVGRPVPTWLAAALGATLETAHRLLRIEKEPMMTRFAAAQLSHAEWFDISAARRDLYYSPKVTIDEGMKRLAASFCAAPTDAMRAAV